MAYDNIIRDAKTQIFSEASEFVKKHTSQVMKTLTNEYHSIIEQFLLYKRQV